MILPKILIFEFKNKGESEVLSRDFSGLRNPCSLIDFTSLHDIDVFIHPGHHSTYCQLKVEN